MKIFGFEFGKKEKQIEQKAQETIVDRQRQGDRHVIYNTDSNLSVFEHGISFDEMFGSQDQRIRFYRKMETNAYVSEAIDEIVNSAINIDTEGNVVTLNLEKTDFSEKIQKKIIEEHQNNVNLMKIRHHGYDLFKSWLVDGVQFVHAVVDPKRTQEGAVEFRFMESLRTRRVTVVKKDRDGVEQSVETFYLYVPTASNSSYGSYHENPRQNAVRVSEDSVIYVWSGILNEQMEAVSVLERAIKPFNQLEGLEDALLVYKISRAPEKRQFNVELGEIPPAQGEAYVKKLSDKYRNKTNYNTATGEITNQSQIQTMFQDFWLPQRNGKGTTIGTVGGTSGSFGTSEELLHYLQKLYKSLKVPIGRLIQEGGGSMPGLRNTEITREEFKFTEYVNRLRYRWSVLFIESLRIQCVLKKIVTQAEWEKNVEDIEIQFTEDSLFNEMKEAEILELRMGTLDNIKDYIGDINNERLKFFTKEFVNTNILRMNSEQIKDQEEIAKKEAEQFKNDKGDEKSW